MPDFVMHHKDSHINDAVLSLPGGATEEDAEAIAATWPQGWSLRKKADPAEVPTPEDTQAAAVTAANTKEN